MKTGGLLLTIMLVVMCTLVGFCAGVLGTLNWKEEQRNLDRNIKQLAAQLRVLQQLLEQAEKIRPERAATTLPTALGAQRERSATQLQREVESMSREVKRAREEAAVRRKALMEKLRRSRQRTGEEAHKGLSRGVPLSTRSPQTAGSPTTSPR